MQQRQYGQSILSLPIGVITPGTTLRMWLTTGQKQLKMQASMTADSAGLLMLYGEDAVQGAGGTAITPGAFNRNEEDTPDFTLNFGASETAPGTTISAYFSGGNEAKTNIHDTEIVLKTETVYQFSLTNTTGSNIIGELNFFWTQDA